MATMSNTVVTPKILPPPYNNINYNTQISSITLDDNNRTRLSRPSLSLTLPPLNLDNFQYNSISNNEENEIYIVRNIDESIKHRMCSYNKTHLIATKCAIEFHNKWRKTYIQQNGNIPCIKKTKDGMEIDINVDGNILHPEFVEFNYNIAIFVATCIIFYPCKDIEETSSIIHRKWLIMSPWANGGPLDVSYTSLPEIEKETYRDIYRTVSNLSHH